MQQAQLTITHLQSDITIYLFTTNKKNSKSPDYQCKLKLNKEAIGDLLLWKRASKSIDKLYGGVFKPESHIDINDEQKKCKFLIDTIDEQESKKPNINGTINIFGNERKIVLWSKIGKNGKYWSGTIQSNIKMDEQMGIGDF
tara:strand:- start:2469 stop:2894 length:426 start_codon:yes stop_codon:yes gene_type:complete